MTETKIEDKPKIDDKKPAKRGAKADVLTVRVNSLTGRQHVRCRLRIGPTPLVLRCPGDISPEQLEELQWFVEQAPGKLALTVE